MRELTLQNLVYRLLTDRRLLEKYPEHTELLTRKIKKTESLIIENVVKRYRTEESHLHELERSL